MGLLWGARCWRWRLLPHEGPPAPLAAAYAADMIRDGRDSSTIVVGIDGSSAALRALDWAVREGTSHGFEVEVVNAWENLPLPSAVFTGAEELRHRSETMLVAQVGAATRGLTDPPPISQVSARGSAATVLIRRSAGAAMLVLGRSRHHAVMDLFGAVSASCVRGAACPVVVVPEPVSRDAEVADDTV